MIGGTLVLRELAREKYSRAIGERQKKCQTAAQLHSSGKCTLVTMNMSLRLTVPWAILARTAFPIDASFS